MSLDPATLSPNAAWAPLKATDWSLDNARHLLHRIGFSATPDRVAQAYKQGLQATLQQAFGTIRKLPEPESVATLVQKRAELAAAIRAGQDTSMMVAPRGRGAAPPPAAQAAGARRGGAAAAPGASADATTAAALRQRQLNQELMQFERQVFLDYVQEWLAFAAKPENSAQENLVLFLGNVLVVGQNKVKDPRRLYNHANLLRTTYQQPYPDIVKAVTYSPAMIQYLDLNTSVAGVPNENYAREVMELFTLGEGHYTENDIKEAARSLTGVVIRQQLGQEQGDFARARWDSGTKTIFGRTGQWGAEDVIDLIFQQPAAHTLLPRRFLAYYLTQDPLPAPYVEELGRQWQQTGWKVDALARLVFSSKLFYQPEFRLGLIKSPLQYYLGLMQDLNLDVSPIEGGPGSAFQNLQAMGQEPFNPPNVRGWLGGKNWINSSTFAARRQLVQQLFTPLNERALTADQLAKLQAARAAGRGAIVMDDSRLQGLADKSNAELTDAMLSYFLAGEPNDTYRHTILDYLDNDRAPRLQAVRDIAVALFQSPEYHLC
ncbi:MAG TPA: DUF1800 family protein [Opitutales bacterium]|nr:DUF1800 family protein [Opitutales bacterium]